MTKRPMFRRDEDVRNWKTSFSKPQHRSFRRRRDKAVTHLEVLTALFDGLVAQLCNCVRDHQVALNVERRIEGWSVGSSLGIFEGLGGFL